jgi:hypothetical protein
MLDIANYGHSLRKSRVPAERDHPPVTDGRRRRRRADSATGVGKRESFLLDDERARAVARVLDESPLTDLEAETDYSETDVYSSVSHHGAIVNGRFSPAPLSTSTHEHTYEQPQEYSHERRSATPSSHRAPSRQAAPPTRIPGPTPRQSTDPPRMPTPTNMLRGSSEPPSLPSTSTLHPSTPQSTASAKRRGKSPAPSASQRSKTTAQKLADKKAQEKAATRESVAQYPAPADGEDMVDAIPSWTQPIPPSGNWDEVVLPVVARKKGLDGQYEHADGSPKPKAPGAVEPVWQLSRHQGYILSGLASGTWYIWLRPLQIPAAAW